MDDQTKFKLVAIIFLLVCIVLLSMVLYELRKAGYKCITNPWGYSYQLLKNSNPDTNLMCSCNLIKRENSILTTINESGIFKK